MDEYLFLTLAKLKADRLKLERELRAQAGLSPRPAPREAAPTNERWPRQRHEFLSSSNWREQS